MVVTREHVHELLDRTHIASRHVQMALGEHPALKSRPDWQAMYEQAVDLLESLYQAIGNELGEEDDGHA